MAFTVGELAKLTGITVRTLHHYDEIGLVQPSDRNRAGYRLYDHGDVLRLQQVLLYRELGLPLDEIRTVLDDPAHSRAAALREHRERLVRRRAQLDALLVAIDTAVCLEETTMQPEDVTKLFDGFDHARYADEAEQRWGATEPYKESARRTKRYGKPEWDAIRRESAAIYERFAELMREGASPTDARVAGVVAAHRTHIDRWFYPCSAELHRGLAEMYVADPRFAANFEQVAVGLAQFIRDAIVA